MKLLMKILGGLGLIILIGYLFLHLILYLIFGTGKHYDTTDLIKNYEERHIEIQNLKEYLKSNTPEEMEFYLEFNTSKNIDMTLWEKSDTAKNSRIFWFKESSINPFNYRPEERTEYDLKYGAKTNSFKFALEKLNWQDAELKGIKEHLDKANCISISKRSNTYIIGFKRSGLGKYYYKIFENYSEEYLKQEFNDGCTHKYYQENIVLSYGGGAIGSQCFEDYINPNHINE